MLTIQPAGNDLNILMISETNVYNATTMAEEIESWGHGVEIAKTGRESLKKFRQKQYDLVLVDISMPESRWDKIITQLKEERPDIGILTMTGSSCPDLEKKVRQKGILYYLITPFEIKDLKLILDQWSHKNG